MKEPSDGDQTLIRASISVSIARRSSGGTGCSASTSDMSSAMGCSGSENLHKPKGDAADDAGDAADAGDSEQVLNTVDDASHFDAGDADSEALALGADVEVPTAG